MNPERKTTINGHIVAEFYWAGKHPVYVDNRLAEGIYEDVVARLEIEGAQDGGNARRDHA